MRLILVFLAAACLATAASAQSGPTTLTMTCAQARGTVVRQGAVVLRTGPTTFDRYVRDASFCVPPERAWPAWARTADVAQCALGAVCQPSDVLTGR